jgi:hypothetical protein
MQQTGETEQTEEMDTGQPRRADKGRARGSFIASPSHLG